MKIAAVLLVVVLVYNAVEHSLDKLCLPTRAEAYADVCSGALQHQIDREHSTPKKCREVAHQPLPHMLSTLIITSSNPGKRSFKATLSAWQAMKPYVQPIVATEDVQFASELRK